MDARRTLMSLVRTQRAGVVSKKERGKQVRAAVALRVRIADLTQGKVKPKDSQKKMLASL